MTKKKPALLPSNLEELVKQMNAFKVQRGVAPAFILTSPENKKVLLKWIVGTPREIKNLLSVSVLDCPIVTPREVMFL